MTENQRTLAQSISHKGVGLHTGEPCEVTFIPAEPDSGIVFVRTDLPESPRIPVVPENALYDAQQGRRTILKKGNAEVHTVEHLLSAVTGMGIDNLVVELNSREPGNTEDGSALPYVESFRRAGFKESRVPKRYFEVPHVVRYNKGSAELLAVPHNGLRLSFTITYDHPHIGTQYLSLDIEPETFSTGIAPARTFVLEEDIKALQEAGLIQGGNLEAALVVTKDGIQNPEGVRFPDELVRHKLLDFLGDLSLLGRPPRGHFMAWRSGHQSNVGFVQTLAKAVRESEGFDLPPTPTKDGEPWDIHAIAEIMPHRYPFLLVDRILDLGPDHVVGLKNVTINEPFFAGHFPNHPIMPAVLIIEAMAQTGGVLLLNRVDRPKSKLVYFMGIDNAKFRRPVLPGDQLRFELKLVRLKGRICKMAGKAYVDSDLVAEADLLSTVVDR